MTQQQQDILPVVIEALVKSAERLEHVTIDTANILKALTNGLSQSQREMKDDLKEIKNLLKNEVLSYKKLEITTQEKIYKIKMAFWTKVVSLTIGSGGVLFILIKWFVLPLLKH